jgi:cobalt/nickel transport system permease protein
MVAAIDTHPRLPDHAAPADRHEGHHHGHDVGERLYLHRHTPVHRLPAHLKIVAAVAFVSVGVATPITRWEAFVWFGIILVVVLSAARIPCMTVLRRATIEVPFIAFAALMPFFGTGETVDVGPFTLYRDGLEAAASIVAKGTTGVLVAIALSATTPARDLVRGFERLRMPSVLVQILSFMIRYVNVVNSEVERMRIARASRGFEARGIRAWPVLARAAGALFIRSYERGERVFLAMTSRGYDGRMPGTEQRAVTARQWCTALAPAMFAFVGALVAMVA